MDQSKKQAKRVKYYVEQEGWSIQAAIIFMSLSAVFRLVGSVGHWSDSVYAATQIALPLISNLLFILLLVLFGRKALWTTAIPVLAGVVFFILKATAFDSWLHTFLCILLYLLVAILYVGTVFGLIRTKWLLPPLFLLPFLYHVFVEDMAALRDKANPISFSEGVLELSVLCIMLALFFTGLAMKPKKTVIEGDLPKIKAPKVIPPARLREDIGAADHNAENSENQPDTELAAGETEQNQSL